MPHRAPRPRRAFGAALALLCLVLPGVTAAEDGWIELLGPDYRQHWTVGPYEKARGHEDRHLLEPDGTWRVPTREWGRVHLYYVGPVANARFTDFELKVEVMLDEGANGGIYFHTAIADRGWPQKGMEIKFNNTHRQRWKTGSLHGPDLPPETIVRRSPVDDLEWFDFHLTVRDRRVISRINGEVMVDYTVPPENESLSAGTLALQQHTKGIRMRNLRVRLLDGG